MGGNEPAGSAPITGRASPETVELVEVGPRDGLQNEKVLVSTADKIELVRRAVAAGARRLEVTSFVHPGRVPQMADAEAVVAGLPRTEGVTYIGLVLNKRGALRALETGVHELGAVAVASDTFAGRNQGQTLAQSVDVACEIIRLGAAQGRRAQATIAVAFGCPFEGEVSPERVVDMARQIAAAGPVEVALADTIGVAVPAQVTDLVRRVAEAVRPLPVRVHFHNTRNTGLGNVWAAVEAGAATVDASIGGLGGCPFAPRATGNVPTEDVAYMFGALPDRDWARSRSVDRGGQLAVGRHGTRAARDGEPRRLFSVPSRNRCRECRGVTAEQTTQQAAGIGPGTRGALADLRVVEMGQLIAGPFCGQLMGDMGADVIKIEPPGKGDPMREWGVQGLWWEVIGRNKKCVSINLRVEAGVELARRLISQADILIENFRPGTLEKWGLGPDRLHADNPGLIIVRMSGYGQTGPYADRTGFGAIGEGMGGWRAIVGEPDRAPSRMGISIGDSLAATYGCMGALAALHHREKTGQGQVVDSALYEAVLQVMESLVAEYSKAGVVRERSGAILRGIAPSNVYRCKDGEYLIGANQDLIFARMCKAMGKPELAEDPRYKGHHDRGRHQTELDEIITAWTSERTVAEVEAAMLEAAVPAGRMYRAADMLADPHFAAREALVEVPTERWGTVTMQNVFPKMSATPGAVRLPAASRVGQHNAEILGGLLGLSDDEIARLTAAGTI